MGIRSDVEGEFFPGENFDLPSGVYVALSEMSFTGMAIEVVYPDLAAQGATHADIEAAEKAFRDALVYRVGLRKFTTDTRAGNQNELLATAEQLRTKINGGE